MALMLLREGRDDPWVVVVGLVLIVGLVVAINLRGRYGVGCHLSV